MKRLSLCILALSLATGGCATTFALIDSNDVMTSEQITRTPLGERQETIRTASYSPAHGGFICESAWRYTRETVHSRRSGYDLGGRLGIGFIGVGELLFGGIMLGGALTDESVSTTGQWTLGTLGAALAVDGIATILIASLIDDFEVEKSEEQDGAWHTLEGCPQDAELVVGTTRVGIDARGVLPWPDIAVLAADLQLAIHHDQRVFPLALNPRARCSLAASLGAPMPECQAAVPEPEFVVPDLRFDLNIDIRID